MRGRHANFLGMRNTSTKVFSPPIHTHISSTSNYLIYCRFQHVDKHFELLKVSCFVG